MYTKALITAAVAAGAMHTFVGAAPTPKITMVTRADGTQECTTHLTASIVSVGPCLNSSAPNGGLDTSFLGGLFDDGDASDDDAASDAGAASEDDDSETDFDTDSDADDSDDDFPAFGEVLTGLEPALGQKAGTTLTADQVGQLAEFSQCGFGAANFFTNLDNSTTISVALGAPSVNVTAVAFVQNASFADISMSVDQAANETIFDPLTIIGGANVANPAVGSTTQLEVALPADLDCTGGATADLCLLRGVQNNQANCVVLKQSKTAAAAAAPDAATAAAARRRFVRSLYLD